VVKVSERHDFADRRLAMNEERLVLVTVDGAVTLYKLAEVMNGNVGPPHDRADADESIFIYINWSLPYP
jgi:hypothetical protein